MEGIHGVDTSWLHHYKAPAKRSHSNSVATQSSFVDETSSSDRDDATTKPEPETPRAAPTNGAEGNPTGAQQHTASEPKPAEQQNGHAHGHHHHSPLDALKAIERHHVRSDGHAAAAAAAASTNSNGTPTPATPPPLQPPQQQQKKGKDGSKSTPSLGRRPSWISSLSSKFGGSKGNDQKEQQTQQAAQSTASPSKTAPSPRQEKPDPIAVAGNPNKVETVLAPASPKPGTGFLSSALRRFSSSTGASSASKTVPNGGICPRMTLNVDHHRDRCQIQDLQPAKLRRVAFCVDVEIAATPVYRDDSPDDPTLTSVQQRKRSGSSGSEKKRQAKTKDKSEGEALKNPRAMAEKKEKAPPKPRAGSNDMFEIPDEVDEAPTQTPNPAKPPQSAPRRPSPPRQKSRPPPPPRVSSNGSAPTLHSDFGPSGMFEVDEFDEVPEPKTKAPEQRNGVGGSAHHDFGRHGMFEIPSASEDEGGPKPKPRRKSSSAASTSSDRMAGPIVAPRVPGHTPSEHLMFELPDVEIPNDSAIADAVSQAAEPEDRAAPTPAAEAASAAGGETEKTRAKQEPEQTAAETVDGANTDEQISEKTVDEGAAPGTRKKEKKKKHEEERKQRKERKKQAAIADGKIPVELTGGDANDSAAQQASNKPKIQNRPTTDPLRIYRRCCSLRETTPLPRVVEQLSSPNACDPVNPAVVLVLDLSGENIDMADLITLSDWLGVVPVQKLVLDRCGLTDETLRMVLAALLAVKTAEQAKHNKHLVKKPREKTKDRRERKGVIAKLSLKDNRLIGRQGWMHIAYFINMSKSLKAIDLSMISFPKTMSPPAPPSPLLAPSTEVEGAGKSRQGSVNSQEVPPSTSQDPFDIFIKCLTDRLGGDPLEEIVMSECDLSGERIEKLMGAIIACRCIRLGLADNNLDVQGLRAVVQYIRSGNCLGIDLGGNDFSNIENQKILLQGLDFPNNQLLAISLAHTNVSPADLKIILPVLASIPGLRFVDFSLNQRLFSESETAIPVFGRYLPRIRNLKRFHLNNVGLRAEHAIALAEICAETEIAHISILENPSLTALANATDEAGQEEACALYASLMTAVRVSKMIMCIDIDVPSKDNSEVVKALAKQVVAYSLRNMEAHELYQSAAALISEPHGGEKAVSVPDVLLHVVGHVDYVEDALDNEPPAPDQDYLVGGTGVVRALSVVLGNKNARRLSRDVTPMQSGTNTPKRGEKVLSNRKAKDMSRQLLQSARKIRHRLQPALVRARAEGEDSETCRKFMHDFSLLRALTQTGKLVYLDNTLDRVITRFEEEYPECREVHAHKFNKDASATATSSPDPEHQAASPSAFATPDETVTSPLDEEAVNSADDELTLASSLTRSRHGSDVSLASRHLVNEEGRLHRFHERMRRELEPVEPKHIEQLKDRIDAMDGEAIKHEVETKGTDAVLRDMNATIDSLRELEKQGGNTWEKCKSAGMQCPSKADGAAAAANHRDSAILDDEDDSGLEMTG